MSCTDFTDWFDSDEDYEQVHSVAIYLTLLVKNL